MHVATGVDGRLKRVKSFLIEKKFNNMLFMFVATALLVAEIAILTLVYVNKSDLNEEDLTLGWTIFGLSVGALIAILLQLSGMFLTRREKEDVIKKINEDGNKTRKTIIDELAKTNTKLDDIYKLLDERLPTK